MISIQHSSAPRHTQTVTHKQDTTHTCSNAHPHSPPTVSNTLTPVIYIIIFSPTLSHSPFFPSNTLSPNTISTTQHARGPETLAADSYLPQRKHTYTSELAAPWTPHGQTVSSRPLLSCAFIVITWPKWSRNWKARGDDDWMPSQVSWQTEHIVHKFRGNSFACVYFLTDTGF